MDSADMKAVPLVIAMLMAFGSAAGSQESGEMLYSMYCSPCHGDGLVNTTNQAFDLRKLTANDRARFENSVLTGKNQMPPWKGVLDHDQIERLWQYVRENAFQK
jgi:mono/diheme cytochrome c family protein